jgi:DNA repair protein RadA/Sms
VPQIGLRAQRLGLARRPAAAGQRWLARCHPARWPPSAPALLVIDSIQTMRLAASESSPGAAAAARMHRRAGALRQELSGCAVIIVGHVTKDGSIAGPKLLEHLVDTVLYFESDAGSRYRMCGRPRTALVRSTSWASSP